ncbi:MAG TPA: class I SAM-dependent methyltransferase [Candidatus Hydrogenedentes bacterium]|nr:class I SAM-dependent methyltransferase [Candidatus Hydrogenedentota bacterium]
MDPKDIVRQGYDKVSRAYRGDTFDSEEDPYYRRCMDLLLPHLTAGSRILDLGCGCGIPAVQDLSVEHDVTGVDISPVQIERARSLVPSAEFICEDMTAIGFPPGGFDAIISLYAIIHVPLKEQPGLFRNISTWLKQDGWFLCTVGHRNWTGTEENWLGVSGVTMFWSHAAQETYEIWLTDLHFRIEGAMFIPEGNGGHTALLAQKTADNATKKPPM